MKLYEVAVRKTDPEMDEYYNEKEDEQRRSGDAPYIVGWSGQSLEWYGDEGPESGRGRYKPKGDGGRIVAINIPTYEMAEKIAKDLEAKLANEEMGEYGKDWYLIQQHDVWLKSMAKMDSYEKNDLKYYMQYEPKTIKDYSKQGS